MDKKQKMKDFIILSFRIMSMLQRLPSLTTLKVSDIQLFTTPQTQRGQNDANNKLRENLLSGLLDISESYTEDVQYGNDWKSVQTSWKKSVSSLCSNVYSKIQIESKGGRMYNYDFIASFYNEADECIQTSKIEFKNNSKSLEQLPQFLSLSTRCPLIEMDYAEFYYDCFLQGYLDLDPELPEKPSKEAYLKHVHTTNYDVLPFFRTLYHRESFHTKEKHEWVNQSLEAFLNTYESNVNLNYFTQKLKESQTDKYYFLWDRKQFHVAKFHETDMEDIHVDRIQKQTLYLKSKTYEFKCLLRWRNHKGILMPAWQIGLKSYSNINESKDFE